MNKTVIGIFLMSLQFGLVQASEIAGVKIDDSVQLEGASTPLVLNGAGIRSKLFIKIYVGTLYLPSKSQSVPEILAMAGPKRVSMHFLYDEVAKEKLIAAWNEGFENNQSADTLAKLSGRLKTFNALFDTAHEGDVIIFDYIPGTGTRVTINGSKKGMVPGADFNQALLAVWLGDNPADDDLKEGMLGG